MKRALTKPRLVTREMTEKDMEFHEAVNDKFAPHQRPEFFTSQAVLFTLFCGAVVLMLCGAIYALRYSGWV